MTRFQDGPAAGQMLQLARAPLFLRAVRGAEGTWDALDLIADEAAPGETIVAYRKVKDGRVVHVDSVDPKTRRRVGHWYHLADYAVYPEQPPEDVLRDNARWREWCQVEHRKLTGPD